MEIFNGTKASTCQQIPELRKYDYRFNAPPIMDIISVSLSQFKFFFCKKNSFLFVSKFPKSLFCSNSRPGLKQPRAAGFCIACITFHFFFLGGRKMVMFVWYSDAVSVGARHVTPAQYRLIRLYVSLSINVCDIHIVCAYSL